MNFQRIAVAIGLLALAVGVGAQTAAKQTYIVQLADPPAATYAGGIGGLAATRPGVGGRLNASSAQVQAYVKYLAAQRAATLSTLGNPKVLHNYSLSFNGFSAQLTLAQAQALKTSGRVLSVTPSVLHKADTTRTPGFLGISAPGGLWSQLDAASRNIKGEDVIIGVIDTGVWPELASFGDSVDGAGNPVPYNVSGTKAYGPPPAKWHGTCVTGPGFTAAMCNNKLIGARFYGDAWLANAAASGGAYTLSPNQEYLSPRDGAGHGTHTSSTAGGNSGVAAVMDGVSAGTMSGIAPRARIAVYKALWTANTTPTNDGGWNSDILAAIDDAVADGVDVINFSVSGTKTDFLDPVEIAYLNATAAGIFVAASAGNSGPGNQVAHMSPWLTTVAASTHDRYTAANVTLGSGDVFNGPSYQGSGVPSTPLIRSQDAGIAPYASLSTADKTALLRCYNAADRASLGGSANAALDPVKVAGKVLVCIRGGNVLVNKADSAKSAGAVALIIQNTPTTAATQILQPYVIPTVHLAASAYPTVNTYAAGIGATASFSPGIQVPGVVAPVMADFSSRGPNIADPNILKPDVTAPGVDIIAGYIATLTQAQHDALAAGSYTPPANAASLQGTSMSSPHVAGSAALLRQLHPTWSPAAIKSALMTTTTGVKLASGAPDTDRWGYGAGHIAPNGAGDPGLVYDLASADYGKFLCGEGLLPPAGIGTCAALGSVTASNLNLASITAANVPGSLTLTRTVKNVGPATATYIANWTLPGWNVTVSPASLTLPSGGTQTFSVTVVKQVATPLNTWSFGTLGWSDGTHTVASPLSARAIGFSAPAEVSDTRPGGKGSKVVSIVSAYDGSLTVEPTGLVPATRVAAKVTTGATQCFDTVVGAGAQLARFQLFNADTQGGGAGTDLDLEVFNGPGGTGTSVGASGTSTSDEVVKLSNPAAGTYSACVTGYATPAGGASYTLSSWVVGPAGGTQTLKAAAPSNVYAGGSASIGLGWSVAAGKRYLGNLNYYDNTANLIGSTAVFVDNR